VDTINQANATNNQNLFSRQERENQQKFTTGERQATEQFDLTKTQYTEGQQNKRQQQDLFTQLSGGFSEQMMKVNQDPNMTQQAKDWSIKQLYDTYKSNLNIVTQAGQVPNVSNLLTNWAPVAKPDPTYRNYVAPPVQGGGGGGKVICTRLHELGLMPATVYLADQLYGELLYRDDPGFMAWYHSWAEPLVALMHGKTKLSRLFISAVGALAKPWARQMAYEMGVIQRSSRIGRLMMSAGRWVFMLSTFKENCHASA
jgi:hypothetical protein